MVITKKLSITYKPLMTYDGGCGFCRYWVKKWHRLTGNRVYYFPYQRVAKFFPSIDADEFSHSVVLIMPTGQRLNGAAAVFRALTFSKNWRWLWWLYQSLPGFAPIAEMAYRWVSRHRPVLGRLLASWLRLWSHVNLI